MSMNVIQSAPPWIRSRRFDLSFVAVPVALAAVSGAIVLARPDLFLLVLALDIWLLGFHHVVATYSRLGADRDSVREHLGLITRLPIAVLVAVLAVGLGVGFWALTMVYLYWQWFHYTRQSWGIARVYERKSGGPLPENPRLFAAAFYLLPLWGILHRSHQSPDEFLRVEVKTIPVPSWLVTIVGASAILAMLGVAAARLIAWRNGTLPVMHTVFFASHLVIFAAGYLLIGEIDHGWLVINVWHNAQYLAFVWHFNNRHAAEASTPTFIQQMSSGDRVVLYFALSIAASTVIYLTLQLTLALIVAPIIVYQTINFHHYIVDSRIWKVRQKPLQATLGLPS
ncbi:MAG: hypothetical protein HKN94_09135 [Acidimicrobiales bacterium]|nr:hypothetical protein [Acidimicrobiales bacterium]